ncbi:uncharacterized protein LOC105385713 isoform X1 [Plutella xylostella]|uniref:uncharacterized protein LOC105385713 isoform X1 n=1 Tax=Plutella xylostella TaxID=51655 RepID=UPI002032A0B4|nr:uncharacterized protein LOC105385713 isoform X1 [Plutella xylostella]
MRTVLLVSLFLFGAAYSSDLENETVPTEESLKRGLSSKCGLREPSSCIALELVGYVDRVLRTATIQLSDDVMIVDESNGVAAHTPVKSESLARAGSSLEDQAQQLITDKLWAFATTRSLRYRMMDNADLVISGAQEADGSLGVGLSLKAPKAVAEGRSRNKNMGPILAMAAMKFGLLGALTFKGLTLLVGKALLISKIALLLATIIGLKKLFSHQTIIKKD